MTNDCESSVKTEDKKGQMRWTTAMDNVLLGSFALNGMDDINIDTIKDSHDQQTTCENNDVEEVEDSMSSKSTKKRPSSSSTKPPPKKVQNTDKAIEILEGVNKNLEKLREIVDPLTFGKQLRDGVFGVEGFSVRFLNAVFRILMKDHSETKIFILSDEEGRKDMLHDLRRRIGEL
ncbi:hypothetical protein IFM89_001147 [Coptis chinensis]|uniref:Uncharacterized protein n=1 Tax=Coptis chinensis TaxID=261450 RepID=A0A835IJT8_9MAGN|nr:hypothetical protein IFM89_001147 [Coptis chinensis]